MEEGENQVSKRITLVNEDRISALPDCLLVEIPSRLRSIEGAIRAGTLSKRWKHVWTFVPSLCFFERASRLADFVLFIDKTLTQRPQVKLKKFLVSISYDVQYESQVKSWIRYAITCNVEVLTLYLWTTISEARDFLLDPSFFICSCFTDLTLKCCMFNPVGAISWNNLRRLGISFGNLDEVLIENIISGSPQLETLVLDYCYGYRRLDIKSKSLKNLVFSGYCDPNDESDSNIIEINAPCILSLVIHYRLLLSKLLLLNVSSLVKAILDYTKDETTPEEAEEEMLKGFMLNLRHVKELKILASCSKVLSRLEAKGFTFPSNMKFYDVRY